MGQLLFIWGRFCRRTKAMEMQQAGTYTAAHLCISVQQFCIWMKKDQQNSSYDHPPQIPGNTDAMDSESEFIQKFNPGYVTQVVPQRLLLETKLTQSQSMFENTKITAIYKFLNFIRIDVCETSQTSVKTIKTDRPPEAPSTSAEEQVVRALSKYEDNMEAFFQKNGANAFYNEEQYLQSYLSTFTGRKEVIWYVPFRGKRPRLASVIITNELLRQIGYDPENQQEVLEMERFKFYALDLITQKNFQTVFPQYMTQLNSYFEKGLSDNAYEGEIFKHCSMALVNEFRGKKVVKANVMFNMYSPFLMTYQIQNVIEIKELNDPAVMLKRQQILERSRERYERVIQMYEEGILPKMPVQCTYIKLQRRGKRLNKKDDDQYDNYEPSKIRVNQKKKQSKKNAAQDSNYEA